MNPFQTFRDGNYFFSCHELCLDSTRCGGWSPAESKPRPLMGSTEASRRDCGIFCLWAPAVTCSAMGMSWADGCFALAVVFMQGVFQKPADGSSFKIPGSMDGSDCWSKPSALPISSFLSLEEAPHSTVVLIVALIIYSRRHFVLFCALFMFHSSVQDISFPS